jgi:hypothetical protein
MSALQGFPKDQPRAGRRQVVVEKVLTAPGPLPRRTAMQHALSQDMLDTGVAGDA